MKARISQLYQIMSSHMPRLIGIILLAAVMTAACSDKSTPAAPSPAIDLTGTWAGDLTVLGTTARMTWTLTQRDMNVTGPVLIGLPTGTVLLNGTLTGTLTGSSLAYTIAVGPGGVPTQPTCTGQIAGTMTASIGAVSTLMGTSAVTGSNCAPPFPGGTITLTKR